MTNVDRAKCHKSGDQFGGGSVPIGTLGPVGCKRSWHRVHHRTQHLEAKEDRTQVYWRALPSKPYNARPAKCY